MRDDVSITKPNAKSDAPSTVKEGCVFDGNMEIQIRAAVGRILQASPHHGSSKALAPGFLDRRPALSIQSNFELRTEGDARFRRRGVIGRHLDRDTLPMATHVALQAALAREATAGGDGAAAVEQFHLLRPEIEKRIAVGQA